MAIFIPLVTKFDPKGLQGAQRALASFQNFAVDVGRVAAAAISAVAVASVREASQFESTFAKIQGLVGLTTAEIEQLEEAAKKLGPQFGVSGNEAAEALFFITSSGLRGSNAIDVLEASLKGAAIGLGDVNAIANAATAAMNTYGPSVLSGTEAVDALAESVRLGQFAPEELAGSLGRVIPISAELGISIQETLGVIAGLTRGGLNASEAVTGVRGAFQAFLKPTGEANKTLEAFGLSADGVKQSIRDKGFLNTVIEMRDAFGDNEDAITRVFGSMEGLNAVLSLTGENVDVNTGIISEMTDGVGILDDAFDTVSETSEFKFNKAMETARGSLLEIGNAILDNLQPHLDTFQEWIEENGPAIEQGFIDIFDGIDEFLSSEMMADMMTSFRDTVPHIEDMVEALGDLSEDILPFLPGAIDFVTGAISLMADAVGGVAEAAGLMNDELHEYGILSEETPTITDKNREFFASFDAAVIKLRDHLREVVAALFTINTADTSSASIGGVEVTPGVDRRDTPARTSPERRTLSQRASPISGTDPRLPFTIRGTRAGGGPVSEGNSFLVGEMGPELFTPADGGNITPNDQLGGTVYNITVNAGMGAGDGARLGEQIVSAIKRFERSSGKVFVSV